MSIQVEYICQKGFLPMADHVILTLIKQQLIDILK